MKCPFPIFSCVYLFVSRMKAKQCLHPAVTHSRAVGMPVGQMMSWCCCRPMSAMPRKDGRAVHQTVTQMTVEMKQPEGKTQEEDLRLPPLAQCLVFSLRVSLRTNSLGKCCIYICTLNAFFFQTDYYISLIRDCSLMCCLKKFQMFLSKGVHSYIFIIIIFNYEFIQNHRYEF